MKKVIKLEYSETYDIGSMDYDIKYLGDELKLDKILEVITELNSKIHGKHLTVKDIFLNYVKGQEQESFEQLKRNSYLDNEENYETLQDFIDCRYDYLLEQLVYEEEHFERLCTTNNCNFGTVGYSPWSYYVSWGGVTYSFIEDLYSGCNWYTLTLIGSNGREEDSIGWCYTPNEDKLDEFVRDYFGLEDYLLVDNDASKYFNRNKVEEIKCVTYSYKPL